MKKLAQTCVAALLMTGLTTAAYATTHSATVVIDQSHQVSVVPMTAKTSDGKTMTVYVNKEDVKNLKPGEKVEMACSSLSGGNLYQDFGG